MVRVCTRTRTGTGFAGTGPGWTSPTRARPVSHPRGRGIVARKGRVEGRVEVLLGFEVVGGWRSSNSSSLMGDAGSGVDGAGAGRAWMGAEEEKRAERVVEGDMGGLFDTEVCISGDVGKVGTCRKG